MNTICAKLLDKPNGEVITKTRAFSGWATLFDEEDKAIARGQRWSGGLATNIALNRHRHSQCPYCGAKANQAHRACVNGLVNKWPYKQP